MILTTPCSQLRTEGRQSLKDHWGKSILICFIFMLISGAVSYLFHFIPFVGFIGTFFILGPMTLGLIKYFINLVRGEEALIENLFDGFKSFVKAFLLQFLIWLFTFLWSLLLVIPGIIKGLSYSMSFYILNDNPELSALDAINASKEMMQGNKWKLFKLQLSFIGWGILASIPFGIGYLWLLPYMQATVANFYNDLKSGSVENMSI